MLEALARKKAHRLMDRVGGNEFGGKKRPQEDMITSAVFGDVRLLTGTARHEAIKLLLGVVNIAHAQFDTSADLHINLWPRLSGGPKRKFVEPDVLLSCAGKTVLVEVKWHANLSERQIEQQIEAAEREGHDVVAAVLLGEAEHAASAEKVPVMHRTWRDVSADLRSAAELPISPLRAWAEMLRDALQNTDMGHTFAGLDSSSAVPVEALNNRFISFSRAPWLRNDLYDVPAIGFKFQRNER